MRCPKRLLSLIPANQESHFFCQKPVSQKPEGGASFMDHLCYFCLILLCFHVAVRLFADALWSPAGKGLPSWLSFVMSYRDVVTFPLVSWGRCGA